MSDDDLFSSDSEYDEIEEPETPFWEGFNIKDYNLNFDLQKSAFLIDLLKDLYKFKLENGKIIIYEKENDAIEEIIEIDKLIYFLHIDLARILKKTAARYSDTKYRTLYSLYNTYFNDVKTIHETIDNMKIYLKYHEEESEEESDEEENKKPLIKEVKTKKYNKRGNKYIKKEKEENFNMLRPTVL